MTPKKILENLNSKYLNIGITRDGAPRRTISVPWKHTAHAFNMRIPDVYLSVQDLKDPEIAQLLRNYHIHGCYIFDPLDDHSFIADFKELWDVHIRNGNAITDISFMRNLDQWFMFYIEDTCIADLEPLFPKDQKRSRIHSYCVGFVNCTVKDISAFEQDNLYFSELLVVQPAGTNERERWKKVRTGSYTYNEYK